MNINFLIGKEQENPRLLYALDFLKLQLGYPCRIIRRLKDAAPADITVIYSAFDKNKAASREATIYIFDSGQVINPDRAELAVDLWEHKGQSSPVIGRKADAAALKGWRLNKTEGYYKKTGSECYLLNFDLFLK